MTNNYKSYPNVIPEDVAVGYPSGTTSFFAYAPCYLAVHKNSAELAGLASFEREKLLGSLQAGESPSDCIQEIAVRVRTVEELMVKRGFSSFDCLFLDCEGHEENILLNLDYETVRPRLIAFEHTHCADGGKRIEAHLAARGFQFTRLTHDTIASLSHTE